MASRPTRNSVRTTKPAQQQHLNKNFVSGGSVQPNNTPVVTYPTPVTSAATPQTPTSAMDTDGDITMKSPDVAALTEMDEEQLKAEKRKFFLSLKKVPGVRKKPNKQLVQRRLRKHLTPKNATMALQEVCPGASYNFSLMPGSSPALFTAEVEINGKQYHGVGSNKSLARAAAAERALQSFVRTQTVTTDDEGKEKVEDTTPWSALAGFALHKLFCDWRQGRVGAPLSVEAAGPPPAEDAANGQGKAPAAPGTATAAPATFKNDSPAPAAFQSFSAPADTGASSKPASGQQAQSGEPREKKPKAPKQLPTDAVSRHPVMLLHEMRPNATFDMTNHVLEQPGGAQGPSITITATVDGQVYKGTARTKKVAKRLAAKAANTAIFGVEYPEETE